MFSLNGKTAIVTGGSRGIGYGLAKALASRGAAISVVVQSSIDRAEALVREVEADGGRAIAVQADISTEDGASKMAAETLAGLGGIDILVNNAGIVRVGPAEDFSYEDWRATMATNLDGVFLASRAVSNHMIGQKSGTIINIGSMSGRIVNWPFRHAAYNASKAAVHMLTKCLATEWAEHGIRVNAIAPGYIRTELTDEVLHEHPDVAENYWKKGAVQGRIGEVEELAGAVVYLASDEASFTTGEVLTVDGGFTLR